MPVQELSPETAAPDFPVPLTAVQQRYADALNSLVEKLKQDRIILAAILCGSMSHDSVWEKSDIDLILVGREEVKTTRGYNLVEDGINIHAVLYPRSKFRENIEKSVQSSFFHSYFSKSTLLYTTDDSIRDYYENVQRMGDKDREAQLFQWGSGVLGILYKAEKWFYKKRDWNYAFLYIMFVVDNLAHIEAAIHREIAGREVIHQALRLNPDFFNAIYTDLINAKKDEAAIQAALNLINGYLDDHTYLLFQPLLDYLNESGGLRTSTDIEEHFKKRLGGNASPSGACEYLADKGIIQKVPAPLRLSEKSRATVDEAAYYYDGSEL